MHLVSGAHAATWSHSVPRVLGMVRAGELNASYEPVMAVQNDSVVGGSLEELTGWMTHAPWLFLLVSGP